ncbi:MAG TPA: FUSC family protein [Candidatus Cybelea sp.]|jgi:multidrug resistance protein MdtO|nr:FUSC family protein [Candidatus Cybelea sp.]
MTAAPAFPLLSSSRFWAFLSREMAPTPGRWEAALRVTLSCVICTIPVMAFHLQQPLIVMILMFAISKEDTTTTLLGTIIGVIGFTIGCAGLLVFYLCALDLEWLRVLAVPAFITLGLFLNRVLTVGPLGTAISLPLAMGMITPDTVSSPEYLNRYPFYFWWAGVLGLCVNLAVQYLLNPKTSHWVLVHGMATRLDAVEAMLRRRAMEETRQMSGSSISSFAFTGAAEQLRLLKLAGIVEPLLKRRQLQFTAEIILMDRLVTAAAALENRAAAGDTDSDKRRMLRVADACAIWRSAMRENRTPDFSTLPREEGSGDPGHEAFPLLAEMERVVQLLPQAYHAGKLPGELGLPSARKGGAFAPDAFTNPEYIHFAVKGALAAFICYLIFTMFAYQGIYTSVVTCVVCSLSTIGASVQKGVLRLAGAVVGGLLGVVALMYIFPNVDSLGGFWFPFAAVTALAAYVHFGGPGISYCGYQIGIAFFKCALQSYGTYTELRVVRDRFVGIALGLIVFQLINTRLWPVSALETMRAKLAGLLHLLARIARLPDDQKSPAPRMAEAYALRLQVYKNFATLDELRESSEFEPGVVARNRIEAASEKAKALFLCLLAVIQQRPDLRPDSVPGSLRAASTRFREMLADLLDDLSLEVANKVERRVVEVKTALRDLEQTMAADMNEIPDVASASQIHGRFALYKEATSVAVALARLQTGESFE